MNIKSFFKVLKIVAESFLLTIIYFILIYLSIQTGMNLSFRYEGF